MPLRNFSCLALVFVVLFAVLVRGNLFPLQLLNPTWPSRVVAALVNGATLPLTALALLQEEYLRQLRGDDIQEPG